MATVNSAHGEPLAILNHNEPVFYCIPPKTYQAMINIIEDMKLIKIGQERLNEEEIDIDINDL